MIIVLTTKVLNEISFALALEFKRYTYNAWDKVIKNKSIHLKACEIDFC